MAPEGGSNSEEYVELSKVRPGLKREFEFAMKSQCEITGSLSRLRARKRVAPKSSSAVRRKVVVVEQAEGEVVDSTGDFEGVVVESSERSERDGDGDGVVVESNWRREKMKVKRKEKGKGKEKEKKGVPTRMKELLETGILEGLNVWYIRGGTKSGQSSKQLGGVIKGTSILCFCTECKGLQTVTPNLFELHAGSANKRPADYIHLDNGHTIRDVLNVCKQATPDSIAAAIRSLISSSLEQLSASSLPEQIPAFSVPEQIPAFSLSEQIPAFSLPKQEQIPASSVPQQEQIPASSVPQQEQIPAICSSCREPISEAGTSRMTMLCDSCYELSVSQTTPKPTIDDSESTDRSVQRASLQRTRNVPPKASSSSSNSDGKLTRKDLRLHKSVLQDDILPDGTELGYYVNGKKRLSGFKKGSGICCGCCNTVVSASQFESHAGFATRRKPYLQIYTSNGMSLHEISVNISKERGISIVDNDELCNVCRGRGELLCCDGCPRVFHLDCIFLPSIPEDKWYCKLCDENLQVERFAERNPNAIAAGRIPGVDPMEQITNRCIRIVNILDNQVGGCALCRLQDFCRSGFGTRTVIICDQCEKEYHVGCLKEHEMQDLKELPEGDWFCSFDCERINSALNELLQQGEQKLPDDLVRVVKKKVSGEESNEDDLDIRWRVLHGRKSSLDEIRPLISKAVSVFHEQFSPILYGANKQDLIPHIVYGKNVKETEFGGMYCAVLTVNSTIVSAGVFRVFSKEVAEIPLVATSKNCEGKGYFQCLYSCLERFLKDQGVKNLLLPAAEETRSLWTNRFGFNVIQKEKFDELRMVYPILTFDGTSMLRKVVAKPST